MQMKILTAAAALVMALFPARAHSPKIGIHGGPQVDAGSFHVEIIPQGTVLQVYFRDHSDKVVSTQGWKGIAMAVEIPAKPKGAVQVTTSSGNTVQAKFD